MRALGFYIATVLLVGCSDKIGLSGLTNDLGADTGGLGDTGADGTEICGDGLDNDADGDFDCYDDECIGDALCIEDCADNRDNDVDGDVDCYDADCVGVDACLEDCGDGIDNDLDGLVDCDDDECIDGGSCVEDCTDGLDNDADDAIDCYDTDCSSLDVCQEDCADGVDNDVDDAIDCADSDCADSSACNEDCDDGEDNDLDGATDCADSECEGHIACVEFCDDGLDNDADGDTDCYDDECIGEPECTEDCEDGLDNDVDGDIDCDDDDCIGKPACPELCDDGIDNDGDGLADCADPDCVDECMEDCDDGIDNDGDGDSDCDDDECYGVDGCDGPYNLVLETEIEFLNFAFGSYFIATYGHNAAMSIVGSVRVDAEPDGWTGSGFSCVGEVYSLSETVGLEYLYGSSSGINYAFTWTLSETEGSLSWTSSTCPLDALPTSYLGIAVGYPAIYRAGSAYWYRQYYDVDYTADVGTVGSRSYAIYRHHLPTSYYSWGWSADYYVP